MVKLETFLFKMVKLAVQNEFLIAFKCTIFFFSLNVLNSSRYVCIQVYKNVLRWSLPFTADPNERRWPANVKRINDRQGWREPTREKYFKGKTTEI